MGVLINGEWTNGELPQEISEPGQFKRADSEFRDRITADGSSGFKAEPGRYLSTSPTAAPGRTAP
jgi:glutathionyl-hydroquinone reductase